MRGSFAALRMTTKNLQQQRQPHNNGNNNDSGDKNDEEKLEEFGGEEVAHGFAAADQFCGVSVD